MRTIIPTIICVLLSMGLSAQSHIPFLLQKKKFKRSHTVSNFHKGSLFKAGKGILSQSYDPGTGEWIEEYDLVFGYDTAGNNTTTTAYDGLIAVYFSKKGYDSYQALALDETYINNGDSLVQESGQKFDREYDSQGRLISEEYSYYSSADLNYKKASRTEYSYYPNHLREYNISYDNNGDIGYISLTKYEEPETIGYNTIKFYSIQDTLNPEEVLSNLDFYEFDIVKEIWDINSGDILIPGPEGFEGRIIGANSPRSRSLLLQQKTGILYQNLFREYRMTDDKNNIIESGYEEEYNPVTREFEYYERDFFTYDYQGDEKISELYETEESDLGLSKRYLIEFFDFKDFTSIGKNPVPGFQIYPNPASEFLNFDRVDNGKYQIFNSAGQLIKSGNLSGENSIAIHPLPHGTYFINLVSSKGKFSSQFVK